MIVVFVPSGEEMISSGSAEVRLLLGGGANGLDLYLYDLATGAQTLIGRAGSPNERIKPSLKRGKLLIITLAS